MKQYVIQENGCVYCYYNKKIYAKSFRNSPYDDYPWHICSNTKEFYWDGGQEVLEKYLKLRAMPILSDKDAENAEEIYRKS